VSTDEMNNPMISTPTKPEATETPTQWYVTDETMFLTARVDALVGFDFETLEAALDYATCTDAPTYVWHETKFVRKADAVAIGGELYFRPKSDE
jgi:hypothetical protein